jgi:YVTN family beta-propeller protein
MGLSMTRIRVTTLVLPLLMLALVRTAPGQASFLQRIANGERQAATTARIRRPVALVLADDGKRLLVANRKSGSISVIDTETRVVRAEYPVGGGLSALASMPDGRHLLALDQPCGKVLLLAQRGDSIDVRQAIAVSPDPVRLVRSRDGLLCAVASRWSRRLTLLQVRGLSALEDKGPISVKQVIDIPFSPGELIALADGSRILVADAFGGKLAVVDARTGTIETSHSIPAHNIRGLALTPDGESLVVAHQTLNPLARSTFDDIHWGQLIGNHLRILPLAGLLRAQGDPLTGSRSLELGDVGHAAGDPSSLTTNSLGHFIVTLGGVDELAIVQDLGRGTARIRVSRRPVAAVPSPDGKAVFVADTFDDTVSVVDVKTSRRVATIPLGPRPELTLAERGELLFFDARLSHDGWMSCHSCHTDGHSSGMRSDTLGDGSYDAPKLIPSLLGVGSTGPWTWIGTMGQLEGQVRKSILTTMHEKELAPVDDQVTALTAYLRALAPVTPAQAGASAGVSVARGRAVFDRRKCSDCHIPPEYTAPARFDVGISDEVGNHLFNPPSLRGVSFRGPYLHDGRAQTLEDVFQTHRHPRETLLAPEEVADLVAFLKTL